MFKLNYKSGASICDQIVNAFVRMKALGVLKSGEQLPSVRSLAVELGVNPNTIQKAYSILEINGIIYSVKGKGSFISDGAAADTAVISAAKKDFRKAVAAAAELGLGMEELLNMVREAFESGSVTELAPVSPKGEIKND